MSVEKGKKRVKRQNKTSEVLSKPQSAIVKESAKKTGARPAYPRSRNARSMRLRCTVVLGTLKANQLRTSSSRPMPCM